MSSVAVILLTTATLHIYEYCVHRKIHPSIHPSSPETAYPFHGDGAGANPSCHWASSGVHPG